MKSLVSVSNEIGEDRRSRQRDKRGLETQSPICNIATEEIKTKRIYASNQFQCQIKPKIKNTIFRGAKSKKDVFKLGDMLPVEAKVELILYHLCR